jgi:hypothetical protein
MFDAVEQATGGFLTFIRAIATMARMSKMIYAYLAGAVDADGFITIQRSRRTKGANHKHAPTYYIAKIGFTETDPTIPTLLKEHFGGSSFDHQPTRNPTHKRVYMWQATNLQAEIAISALFPYLRLKRRQAEIALDFIRLAKRHNGRKLSGRLTPEIIAERQAAWFAITALNAPRNRRVHFVGSGN